ncbi:hypothetical protein QC764_205610 [Podospora pseudoanserina]|uniref:CENP-V/GFA domain-containing protein n=1 Tax=Podospora pseudoanserina TaxID=2609844 RepID=A0ABR0IHM1_9PEZI|nr:hypothetical protein QC764_205610 [Podospora pseudoanserina]
MSDRCAATIHVCRQAPLGTRRVRTNARVGGRTRRGKEGLSGNGTAGARPVLLRERQDTRIPQRTPPPPRPVPRTLRKPQILGPSRRPDKPHLGARHLLPPKRPPPRPMPRRPTNLPDSRTAHPPLPRRNTSIPSPETKRSRKVTPPKAERSPAALAAAAATIPSSPTPRSQHPIPHLPGQYHAPNHHQTPPLRRPPSLESLVPKCNQIGRFQRLNSGNPSESPFNDAAFICDFCNGYLVWPDLRTMPSVRSTLPQQPPPDPLSPAYDSKTVNNGYPHWQASGLSCTANEPKTLVFAPLAIANHMPPEPGEWQAGIVCPYCEEDTYLDEGEDSGEMKYVMDDKGFGSVEEFREHLEWYHTAMAVPKLEDVVPEVVRGSCGVM